MDSEYNRELLLDKFYTPNFYGRIYECQNKDEQRKKRENYRDYSDFGFVSDFSFVSGNNTVKIHTANKVASTGASQ